MTVTGIQFTIRLVDGDDCYRHIYQNISNEHASITEFNEKKIVC